ncbi:hypothetical protein IMZ48_24740, partial [Candidatus Bathyarchaeota archaeon]|nr:hypothetical protein [Candidatus Bathyarchaeota archaeon]
EEEDEGASARGQLGGIPNTMRRSLREDWVCEAVLPKVHTRDIYSVAWSSKTGLVASTGSDGIIAIYKEDEGVPLEQADGEESKRWKLIARYDGSHGAYEVNHATWCKRYDAGAEENSEMLVTTGDDGLVRTWAVSVEQ